MTAALRLLDREGETALTFARLGAELKASPTSVYRHFASRQDVVIAVADSLDGISLTDYEPSDDWRTDLEELAWRAWHTAVAHPAAAGLAMVMVTNRMNELRAVDAVLRALHMAGLHGQEAVAQYQVYANLVLGAAGAHGARLAARENGGRSQDWVQVYAPTDPTQYPYAEALKSQLRLVDYDEVFRRMVAMFLDNIEAVVAADAASDPTPVDAGA